MPPFAFTEENIQLLFGHEAAEDESLDRLKEYYLKNRVYERIIADLPLRILVGHKGVGKSALFKVAMSEDVEAGNLPILIRPDDITGLRAEADDFLLTIRNWKLGLNSIISQKVLTSLGMHNEERLNKLANYGGKVLNFLVESVKIVKEHVDLEPVHARLRDNFLRSKKISIYIDDLDRGWQSRKDDISRISALLNAVRDITNENPGIQFKVGLRSDVYFLVRTADESTDKIEGSVVWYSWTNHEILILLIKRIETFWGREVDEARLLGLRQNQLASYLDSVMVSKFQGVGKWSDVPTYRILMSLTRKRPRDLVKLCTLAARQAYEGERQKITTTDFSNVFEEYSQGRIQDTINEFKSELPEIERLLFGMRPNKRERQTSSGYTYSTDTLLNKIKAVEERGQFRFATGKVATPKDLAQFMYKINFLTARKALPTGEIQRKYFEESRYLSGRDVDFGYSWEVHPAYRWALQPEDLKGIFKELELSAD